MPCCDLKPNSGITQEQCVINNICDIMIPSVVCHQIDGHTKKVSAISLSIPAGCSLGEVVSVQINGTVRNLDDPSIYGYSVSGTDVTFNSAISASASNPCYGKVTYTVMCSLCDQLSC